MLFFLKTNTDNIMADHSACRLVFSCRQSIFFCVLLVFSFIFYALCRLSVNPVRALHDMTKSISRINTEKKNSWSDQNWNESPSKFTLFTDSLNRLKKHVIDNLFASVLPHAWSVINKSLFIVSKCMNIEEKLMCTQLISFIPILKCMFFFCHGTPKTSTKKKLLLRIFTSSTTTCILKWLGRVHRSRIFIYDTRH